ncbi:MAG: response regulator [Thermodesulfovibrionales bacterium]
MRILIVEDDVSSLVYLQKALAALGYQIDTAPNGIIALQKAQEQRPDLIISDILMPEMDGFELCKRIKTDERLKDIPFVFYTATYIDPRDEQLALSLGASRFLIKPMDPGKLFEVIREVLQNHTTSNLPVYNGPIEDIDKLTKMQIEALTRKLSKKVEELQKEREALQISEYKYRRLYESLMDGFVYIDMQGRFKDFNDVYLSIVGYSADELYQMNYRDITPLKWYEYEDRIVNEQIITRGFSDVYEKEYIRKDGNIIPVELHVFLLKDRNGNNEGMWAIVRDISERKKMEAENKRLQEQLLHVQKLEAIGQLAGGIAHDFNNILHAIMGYASLIEMKMSGDDPLKEYLKKLIECAERGSSLTQQILSFSRKQSSQMKPIDLNEAIRDAEKLLSRLIIQDISLVFELSGDRLPILADKSQIDQILINLVVNARDAIPKEGTILIKTEESSIDKKSFAEGDIQSEKYALVIVKDTGIGMDNETIKRIFEPFFTTKPVGHGTGLGLSVVYGIVKQHNGFISVESQKGHGTTFFIYFPLIREGLIEDTSDGNHEIKGGVETILIADDDEYVRGFLESFLRSHGYNVISAKDGQEALQRFLEHKDSINLCIFDMRMPIIDGKEAIRKVRLIKPEVKIIPISGYFGEFADDDMLKTYHVLHKPLNPKEILITIRKLFDG